MASTIDNIMTELVGLGHTTGSVTDRERARLLAVTGAPSVGNSMSDLYRQASELNRISGEN